MSRRIIDLTYPIHEGMTTYPTHWHPVVEITQLGRHGIENRETRKLVLGTHTGTHCDAPAHFVPGGGTVDRLPLEVLVGPALVVDLTTARPKQEITVEQLERQMGDQRPERVLLRYDWSDRWGSMDFYSENPYLSGEATRWLVDRGVRLLGMDTATPDNPECGLHNPPDSPNHKILLEAGVVLVEYICNLKQLQQQQVELVVLPLKIRDGDGSPVRCIAMESDEKE